MRVRSPLGLGRYAAANEARATSDNGTVATEQPRRIEQLTAEERSLSARRRRVQDRIDFLRSGGRGPDEDVAEELAELVRRERELSAQRRALHEEIELARAELIRRRA